MAKNGILVLPINQCDVIAWWSCSLYFSGKIPGQIEKINEQGKNYVILRKLIIRFEYSNWCYFSGATKMDANFKALWKKVTLTEM